MCDGKLRRQRPLIAPAKRLASGRRPRVIELRQRKRIMSFSVRCPIDQNDFANRPVNRLGKARRIRTVARLFEEATLEAQACV